MPEEYVASQGHDAFRQMKKQERISKNPKHNAMVKRIAKRISEVSDIELPKTEWEFVVFENDDLVVVPFAGLDVGVDRTTGDPEPPPGVPVHANGVGNHGFGGE